MTSSLTPSLSVTSAHGRETKSVEDSPGSSVFDLPVHQEDTPTVEKRPHVFPIPPPPSSGLTFCADGPAEACAGANAKDEKHGPTYLVLSGGTGCNSIVSAFGDACYVLPVSDDGGSSSEIIRVLGGPSIGTSRLSSMLTRRGFLTALLGDIRSRLVRLIPASPDGSPLERIRNLLAYRLSPTVSEREARDEWRDIVEGKSELWDGIPLDRKEVIRGAQVSFR